MTTSQREAQRLRQEAASESAAMKASAEKAADAMVSKARSEADKSKAEAQRDVDAMVRRRDAITDEMARVQGVLDALTGPLPGLAPEQQKK